MGKNNLGGSNGSTGFDYNHLCGTATSNPLGKEEGKGEDAYANIKEGQVCKTFLGGAG